MNLYIMKYKYVISNNFIIQLYVVWYVRKIFINKQNLINKFIYIFLMIFRII